MTSFLMCHPTVILLSNGDGALALIITVEVVFQSLQTSSCVVSPTTA